jgi:hypothetical protein
MQKIERFECHTKKDAMQCHLFASLRVWQLTAQCFELSVHRLICNMPRILQEFGTIEPTCRLSRSWAAVVPATTILPALCLVLPNVGWLDPRLVWARSADNRDRADVGEDFRPQVEQGQNCLASILSPECDDLRFGKVPVLTD